MPEVEVLWEVREGLLVLTFSGRPAAGTFVDTTVAHTSIVYDGDRKLSNISFRAADVRLDLGPPSGTIDWDADALYIRFGDDGTRPVRSHPNGDESVVVDMQGSYVFGVEIIGCRDLLRAA
ncbi:MAG TPA: hypothetical protein VKD22_16555 [Ramlibacter sp.]|nr:hypothetical protein [Ramlibacter sp.]